MAANSIPMKMLSVSLIVGVMLVVFNDWVISDWLVAHAPGGWMAATTLRNLAIGLGAFALLAPPLWAASRAKFLWRKRSRILGTVLFYNALLVGAIGYHWKGPPHPTPVAMPTPTRVPYSDKPDKAVNQPVPVVVTQPKLVARRGTTPASTPTPTPIATATATATAETPEKPSDFAAIDRHALAAPAEVENDVGRLAGYLIQPARNDREKIRAIYRWVSDRIAYDAESFLKGDYPDGAVETTLRRRISVCDGYAKLTQALGEAAGLKIEIVSGFGRGYGGFDGKRENHAWNAVQLSQGWCLLDTTWAAGSLGEDGKFHKEFNPYFFLPDPKQLLTSHFPTEERWQLQNPALSWAEFQAQPKIFSSFYQLGLSFPQRAHDPIQADPTTTLQFNAPENIHVLAQLLDEKKQELPNTTVAYRSGQAVRLHVMAPRAGQFQLRVFAGPYGQVSSQGVAYFTLLAQSGNGEGYPEIDSSLEQRHGKVVTPTAGNLKAGKQKFDLQVPGARTVFINDWDNALQRDGDRFTGELDLPPGPANVFAVDGDSAGHGIVTYQVR